MTDYWNYTFLKTNNIYNFIASLNVVLSLVGYNLVTSIFSQSGGIESQSVTIPFRALILLVALICIILIKPSKYKLSRPLNLLFFYWGILILRFSYDVYFKPELNLPSDRVVQIALYMVCLTIVPTIALLRTYDRLNMEKILYICYWFSAISVILTFFRNTSFQHIVTERLGGNAALGTIGVGHMGLTNLLLSFVIIRNRNTSLLFKIFILLCSIIAFFILLRSGSRGPTLSIIIIIEFYLFSKLKRPILGFLGVICLGLITYFLLDYIIDFLGNISPVLKQRLFDREDQTSDRLPFYMDAINSFLSNPIFGDKFGIYSQGKISYPHNIFLESLMQLGIIGGVIMIVICFLGLKYSNHFLSYRSMIIWIPLLFLQSFTKLLVSSSFSTEPSFTILFVLLVLIKNNKIYISKE